jgi:hypothetical protein
VAADVRDKICQDLTKNDLASAEQYFVARADGWHVFTNDVQTFKGQRDYFVIDWRSL